MNIANSLYSGDSGWKQLQEIIHEYTKSGIFILVDENTHIQCLPLLREKCTGLENAMVIESPGNESNKTIANVENVWQSLVAGNAVRKSLLICVGGGVITDTGGFVAATYKRGMDFIHIPTTLLSMVDAALGGKTGVNLNSIKNQIGVFALPKAVFIFTEFLQTLPPRQKLSGYAEMLKHAMIDSEKHFEKLILLNSPEKVCNEKNIMESASVKMKIVSKDFTETGLRKVLNFGHTIGHAVESYSQKNDPDPLLHGEAIAIGLICESFISMRLFGMDSNDLRKVVNLVRWHFPQYRFKQFSAVELLELMCHDKKNEDTSKLNFSLIRKIGDPVYDQIPGEKLIRESLHFYMNLDSGFFV
jgi:3-dehydroquinate synthase